MTPVAWITFFFGFGAIAELIAPLFTPRLVKWFPFNLMRGKTGEPRAVCFLRIILTAALFGAILGLLGGTLILGARVVLNLVV